MRGVTLIEFITAISLFFVLLFFSYHAFDSQRRLLKQITVRTQPEEESNYRLLLIKHFLDRSSQRLKVDPFLEGAPIFFPDLSFGKTVLKNAFSVAHATGLPISFQRSGNEYKVPPNALLQTQKTYLMTGCDAGGNFGWNYASTEEIRTTTEGFTVRFKPYTSGPELEQGKLIEIEIHGFLFQNQTLYWVSPGGSLQPYLSSLDSFDYIWSDGSLTVHWKTGLIEMEFRCAL
jgi:hypothetical protein